MKKTLIAIIIIITIIISPKVNAKMIEINNETITSLDTSLERKIYKYGTKISLGDTPYYMYYRNRNGSIIAYYDNYTNEPTEDAYIGSNFDNVDIKEESLYWEILEVPNWSTTIGINLIPYEKKAKYCNLNNLVEGDICYDDMIIDSSFLFVIITYYDKEGVEIGSYEGQYISFQYGDSFIGYNDLDEKIGTSNTWKFTGMSKYSGSIVHIYFEEDDPSEIKEQEFTLSCDKDTLKYKEKTLCHVYANNYQITTDSILLTLENKADLEFMALKSGEYFYIDNNNNRITINPKYISTTQEDFELFSFEVKAKKEKNEVENVTISDINYYNDKTYTNLKTTININNTSPILVNPLTERQSLILKVILIGTLLVISTKLLLKKKVYE